jgi:hypothetical protein
VEGNQRYEGADLLVSFALILSHLLLLSAYTISCIPEISFLVVFMLLTGDDFINLNLGRNLLPKKPTLAFYRNIQITINL